MRWGWTWVRILKKAVSFFVFHCYQHGCWKQGTSQYLNFLATNASAFFSFATFQFLAHWHCVWGWGDKHFNLYGETIIQPTLCKDWLVSNLWMSMIAQNFGVTSHMNLSCLTSPYLPTVKIKLAWCVLVATNFGPVRKIWHKCSHTEAVDVCINS